jgi:predicted DNA-binding protein (MmcQ/YjbR family)
MRLDRLKAFALGLPHVTFVKQWGETLVFKIGGKMFLLISLDGDTAQDCTFKCTPADYTRLTQEIDGIVPSPYNLYRTHWVTLKDPEALPEKELLPLIRHSYDLVVAKLPKKLQATLPPPAPGYR